MAQLFSLFTAPETLPFGVALGVLMGIAVIEGLGAFVAASPSAWIEDLLPDDGIDGDGSIAGPLGWLHVGHVPILVLLILFLLGFALGGYFLQISARALLGAYAPAWLATIPAVFVGLFTVRGLGALIARVVPKDETSAISNQSLIGRAGIITGATAKTGLAGQLRLRDAHGHVHYLMVEPDVDGEEFPEGTAVLIVKKVGAVYRGILNPHPDLL